jgi:hypothetical protein
VTVSSPAKSTRVVTHAEPWQGLQLLAHASPGLPLEPDEPPLLEPPLEPPLDPMPLEPLLEPPPLDPDAVPSPPPSVALPELPPFLKLPQAAARTTAPKVKAQTRTGDGESMPAQCVRGTPPWPAGLSDRTPDGPSDGPLTRAQVEEALARCGGDVARVAADLRVSEHALKLRMKSLGVR